MCAEDLWIVKIATFMCFLVKNGIDNFGEMPYNRNKLQKCA